MMEFECNISKEYANLDNHDEWGCAYLWDGKVGAEYNFCIQNGYNSSAIYFMKYDYEAEDFITDHNSNVHYEIDFNDDNWEQKLKKAMISVISDYVGEVKNYITMNSLIPWRMHIIYLDLPKYIADAILSRYRFRSLKFGPEFSKKDNKYILIKCTINRKDYEKFKFAMYELVRKMLILGHTDYIDEAVGLQAMFTKGEVK